LVEAYPQDSPRKTPNKDITEQLRLENLKLCEIVKKMQ